MVHVREAFQALSTNRLQVCLAAGGVAVGVAAVVLLVSIVAGVHRFALEQSRLQGTGLLTISISQPRRTLTPSRPPVMLTRADADALAFGALGLGRTSPRRRLSHSASYHDETMPVSTWAVGAAFVEISKLKQTRGRWLNEAEMAARARVAVLGAGAAHTLFEDADPLGQTVLVNDWPFDVIGVLDWRSQPTSPEQFLFYDRDIYIPYTTAHEVFVQPEQAESVLIEIADAREHEAAARAVKAQLIHRKALTPTQAEWVRVYDSIERTAELNRIMLALKALVGLVGSISLFVGAVGVMNIMIVSVTQRTSEIGVRRAVGARASWVRRQFLFESLVVTGLGGLVGLAVAVVITWIVQLVPRSDFPKPYVSGLTAVVSIAVILLTGIAAGLLPAIRASRITPVEALRHE
jgi:putative ABC transport system permease protein